MLEETAIQGNSDNSINILDDPSILSFEEMETAFSSIVK